MYFMKGSKIKQITKDHSYVQHLIDIGRITKEDAEYTLNKNIITRAVGTEQVVKGDIFHHKLERGDCLLLCSDGLSNIIDEQEILFEVVYGDEKSQCCQRLLEIAKNRGAPDNVTSVLIQV